MKLKKVDPKKIKIPELRVRGRFDEEKLAMLKKSMEVVGMVAPVICLQVDEDLVLVDGEHRVIEAIHQGWPTIDVAVGEGDMVEVMTRNIFLDHVRGKHPVSEMRKCIEALYKEYNLSIEDIVQKTGMSQDYVERLLVISELTPMCLEALDDERIGVGHAAILVKVKDPVQQEVILQQLLTYRWTVKQLSEYIGEVQRLTEQKVEVKTVAAPQAPATVACHFCRGQFLPSELASVICCHTCAGIMYEAIALARRGSQPDQVPTIPTGLAGKE